MTKPWLAVAVLVASAAVSTAVQVPVSMIDNAFIPDTVRISPGDSVAWTNNGEFTHTSTSGVNGVWDSLWDSGNMAHGVTFARGFATEGTFDYFCALHWLGGMQGVVVVGMSGSSEKPGSVGRAVGISSSPNPFSSSTTIRLAPTGFARKAVRVFDASGKLVRTLATRDGAFAVWDGTDDRGHETGPGTYFCICGSRALVLTRLPAAGN
ncbi:hypothetical protein JXD38_08020 [candidate division WOR-3 bacterium]|nr:hypothetical protein [candidate division WOR-3 bacterium]